MKIYINIYVYLYMYTYLCMHTHARMHTDSHAHVNCCVVPQPYFSLSLSLCVCIYICMYIYINTSIFVLVYTFICVPVSLINTYTRTCTQGAGEGGSEDGMLNFLRDMTRRVEASQRTAIERAQEQQVRKSLSPQKTAAAIKVGRTPTSDQQLDGSTSHITGFTSTPHADAPMHSHDAVQTPQTLANRGSSSGVSNTGYMSTSYLPPDGANESAQHGAPGSNNRGHPGLQHEHQRHDHYASRSSGTCSDTASNQWGVVAGSSWASSGALHNDGT
jgi:hypothetical protein